MWPIPLRPLEAAVRTLNVPNVSSCIRDLALAAWCFMWAAFLVACFLRHFFRASALRFSLSSRFLPRFPPWFFRRGGCSIPTTPRILHSRLFCLLTCDLRTILLISRCWDASPPVDAASTLALSASTSSRINRCRHGITALQGLALCSEPACSRRRRSALRDHDFSMD